MTRICKIAIVSSLLLVWVTIVMGNTSSDYFHDGANYYINGKLLEALYEVQTGLEQNPSDPKLNALLQKIQEALQNQQPQQQDQQEQSEEEQQQQEDQKKEDEQQNQAGDENQQQQEQQQQQAEKQDEISKEDAERILKALENQEKEQLQNLKKKGSGRRRSKKEW